MTDTRIAPARPATSDGDHDRFAHIVKAEDYYRGYVDGEPITALCGKRWVPNADPEKYPVCATCSEERARLGGKLG